MRLAALLLLLVAAPVAAQISEEVLRQTGAALHVDVQTGRVAGITSAGPLAEVGAKIVDVLFGDHAAGEWIAFAQRVDGEYVKPVATQRLLLLKRDGGRAVLLDEEFSPAKREALARQIADYRRKAELLTGEIHVPDYLLRSAGNAILHVTILKTAPFDRGRGYLSATHTAQVRVAVQGDFKPGQMVEFTEESARTKRFEPPAGAERIVLLTHSRSVQDGQMKWWLHERANYGYSEAGLATLRADLARVRAAQAAKAAQKAGQ